MSDPIDVEGLLAPLSEGVQGAGEDLRTDYSATSPYQRLRDARSEARAEERASDAQSEDISAEPAGWRVVLSVGQEALSTKSKDLEIAAWLTEALVRLHGLPGLAAGARVISGLCTQFWDGVFPQPDEDGMEGRASPIGGLSGGSVDGTIMQALRRLPLFRRADGSPVGLYQWEQAEQASALDDARRQARLEAGVPELSSLEAEARLDRAFLSEIRREARNAMEAWRALEQVLDAQLGADAPSMRKVTTLLERLVEVATRLGAADDDQAAEGAQPDAAADGGAAVAASGPVGSWAGAGIQAAEAAVMTRERALTDLDRIAEFFRRTEPHSPLAYTLEEAVRRGRMGLTQLLAEVMPDITARNDVLMRLGIRPEPNE